MRSNYLDVFPRVIFEISLRKKQWLLYSEKLRVFVLKLIGWAFPHTSVIGTDPTIRQNTFGTSRTFKNHIIVNRRHVVRIVLIIIIIIFPRRPAPKTKPFRNYSECMQFGRYFARVYCTSEVSVVKERNFKIPHLSFIVLLSLLYLDVFPRVFFCVSRFCMYVYNVYIAG